MTLTVQQILAYSRCGEYHRMTAIEGVPNPPSLRQVVSRAVRDAVQADLRRKLDTGTVQPTPEALQNLKGIVTYHLSGDLALNAEQAATGNRRIFEYVMISAQRMYLLWRGTVAARISPLTLGQNFSLSVGIHEVTGRFEILEPAGIRATKVRSRSPEEGESHQDLALAIQALALFHGEHPVMHATVDYLIDTKQMAYVRQEVEFDGGTLEAAEQRLKALFRALEEGQYLPAPADAWWCRACYLRTCCRFVA